MTPPTHEPFTAGEVARSLERIETALTIVSTDVAKISGRDAADAVRFGHIDTRIDRLESSQRWVTRLVLGIVVTAVLGLVLGGAYALTAG